MSNLQIAFFVVVSVLLVLVIWLQPKNSSLGSMMGMDAGENIAQTRRGAEKYLHNITIFLGILLVLSAVYIMIQNS